MSSNYTYRVTNYTSYNPNGVWLELQHNSSTLSSRSGRDRINGLAKHKGLTESEINFEEVAGAISLDNTKDTLNYFLEVLTNLPSVNNVYDFKTDMLSTLVIEQYDHDLEKTILFKDVGLDSITLNYNFDQINSMELQLLGGFSEKVEGRPSDSGTLIEDVSEVKVGSDVTIDMFNVLTEIPLLASDISLTFTTNLATANPLGVSYNQPIGAGNIIPEGTITIYSDLEAFELWTEVFNNDPVKIVISDGDSVITIFKAYLGGELPSDGGINTEVEIPLDFEGVYDIEEDKIATVEIL